MVVKKDQPRAAEAKTTEVEAPQAPGVLGLSGNSDQNVISGIVASTPVAVPKPVAQTVKVSQGVSQGLITKRVQPVYPQQALQMRLQGAVQMEAAIGKDGSITSVKVLKGDSILARSAVAAVKQWKYKPYFLNGEPVAVETEVTVNFKLP
jgi:protein TonB